MLVAVCLVPMVFFNKEARDATKFSRIRVFTQYLPTVGQKVCKSNILLAIWIQGDWYEPSSARVLHMDHHGVSLDVFGPLQKP